MNNNIKYREQKYELKNLNKKGVREGIKVLTRMRNESTLLDENIELFHKKWFESNKLMINEMKYTFKMLPPLSSNNNYIGNKVFVYIKINHGFWADLVYLTMPWLANYNEIYDASGSNRLREAYSWHIASGLLGSISLLQKGLTNEDLSPSAGLKIGIGKGKENQEAIIGKLDKKVNMIEIDTDLIWINYYNMCHEIRLWDKATWE